MTDQPKPTGYNPATLEHIADGDAIKAVDFALSEAITNIRDLNTEAKAKRKVTLAVTLTPTEDRRSAAITFQVVSSLAPDRARTETLLIGKHGQGYVQARQMTLSEYEKKENENVDELPASEAVE